MADRFITHLGHNYLPEYLCRLSDEELAQEIRNNPEWDIDLLRDLAWRADLIEEWENAGENFEEVAYKAAEVLGVEI